jgi:pimeloyl-ACP methyl ester carboxylesterase
MRYILTTPATVVLVHGAWHGAWCWQKVVSLLDDAAVPHVAVDLPLTSLADDATAVRQVLDSIEGPVVLCGHSYGGVVITETGLHPAVRHLVYVCAFAVSEGASLVSVTGEHPPTDVAQALIVHHDGSTSVEREGARTGFYLDCSPRDQDWALDQLRTTALDALASQTTVAAWRDRPSTYAVCTEDRAIDPNLQRALAKNCTATVEWPTSHSPFVSQPALVADLLTQLAKQ